MRRPLALACLAAALCATACSKPQPRVQLPPVVDLAEFRALGIVEFEGEDAAAANLATRQFVQTIQSAQPGARMVELGSEGRVLARVEHDQLDFEAARAIGEEFGVDAVFVGRLEVGSVKPSVRFGQAFGSVRARADVDGELTARLLETRAGATVWSRTATAQANVASLGVPSEGLPSFGARDPAEAKAPLIQQLVGTLGSDFRPTWR